MILGFLIQERRNEMRRIIAALLMMILLVSAAYAQAYSGPQTGGAQR